MPSDTVRLFPTLRPGQKITTSGQLALVLGGSDSSMIGELLRLFPKADPSYQARFRRAFPGLWLAWEAWSNHGTTPTTAELYAAMWELRASDPQLADVEMTAELPKDPSDGEGVLPLH